MASGANKKTSRRQWAAGASGRRALANASRSRRGWAERRFPGPLFGANLGAQVAQNWPEKNKKLSGDPLTTKEFHLLLGSAAAELVFQNACWPPIGSPLAGFGRYFGGRELVPGATFWAQSEPAGGPAVQYKGQSPESLNPTPPPRAMKSDDGSAVPLSFL